ncbi:TetR/AcrR family transcriptional regulator [Microvirga sp. 2YAF29]|uniref:TetR/AcrR family transcriptional regulator n=1 Tax=Microvirga sp. 2YAF29 TaxID=3233031 RepID=UPI003F9A0CD3
MSDLKDIARTPAPLLALKASGEENPESAKRRQILEGARQVFLARGFDGASMGEIAKVAGVSKGTLYVYFDSKESLFEALTTEEKRGLAEVLFKLDADDPDVRNVLSKLGQTYIGHFSKPEHISSIRMVIGVAEKFPRLGQAFYEAGPCQGTARLAAYLDRQNEAGRLTITDTNVAAQHFLDLCQSGILRRLLFSVGELPTEDEIERNVENAIKVFFAAYGSKT